MKGTKSKKLSVVGDKLMSFNVQGLAKLSNLDDELRYLNKLDIIDGNVMSIFEHRKNLLIRQNENRKALLDNITTQVENANNFNLELKRKLFSLSSQQEDLNTEFNKLSELKKKYYSDIMKIRRENTKEFNNKLNTLNTQDKGMKLLKRELFLLMNLLKVRVLNSDTAELEKCIKGYLVNIENNSIQYVEVNKCEDVFKNCFSYWTSMTNLHQIKSSSNKENISNLNNIN